MMATEIMGGSPVNYNADGMGLGGGGGIGTLLLFLLLGRRGLGGGGESECGEPPVRAPNGLLMQTIAQNQQQAMLEVDNVGDKAIAAALASARSTDAVVGSFRDRFDCWGDKVSEKLCSISLEVANKFCDVERSADARAAALAAQQYAGVSELKALINQQTIEGLRDQLLEARRAQDKSDVFVSLNSAVQSGIGNFANQIASLVARSPGASTTTI